jgi:uncharacterized repeat protein (TIGR01451 family)
MGDRALSLALAAGCAMACGQAGAQVVIGLDNTTEMIRTYNAGTMVYEDFTPNGTVGVRGLAANDSARTLYFITGTQLWSVSYDAPRTPTLVASLSGAITSASGGLAWVPSEGLLYATTTSSLYTINPTTGVTTLVRSFGAGDFGGLDYNADDGKLYMSNDSTSTTGGLTGRGIYTLSPPYATGTLVEIADYPGTETDIDGLAVGGGNVYLSRDLNNNLLYIYSLASGTYTGPITRPGGTTTSRVFCGATYAPGLGVLPPGANVGVAIADPADCTVPVEGTANYTITVSNVGPDAATGTTLTLTIPANADLLSSSPSGTLVGNTLTISLGSIAAMGNSVVTLALRPTSGTTLVLEASVAANEPDAAPGNNTASASATLAPVLPTTATITGVFSTIASSASSDVPGLAPAKFATGITPGRPFRSPNGRNWIQAWDTDMPTSMDQVLLVSIDGTVSVVAQEGVTVLPTSPGGFAPFGSFDPIYGINDAGRYAFSGIDSRTPTTDDGYVVKWDGTALVLVAQEATTPAPPASGGTTFGSTRGSVQIANDGTVAMYHAINGLTTTTDTFLLKNDGQTIVAQEGVTIPTGQAGGGTFTYKSFDAGSQPTGTFFSATHASFISSCATNDATTQDRVAVVDNDVKVQEGQVLAGSTFTSPTAATTPFDAVNMESDGTWFVRGHNADGIDWVARNGVVVAETDTPIHTGATELFDDASFADCFFLNVGNPRGDYAVAGTTNASNGLANAVVVLNGQTVIARENDPVDLDNNGVFDDNVFIRTFVDDRAFMTDDALYVVVRLRDSNAAFCGGADTDLGQALIRVPLPAPTCVADVDDGSGTGTPDGGVTIDDLLYYLNIFEQGDIAADVDNGTYTGVPDGGVTIDDLLYYLFRFEGGC